MEDTLNYKTIAGVEFEAVRMQHPIPHWRAKVVQTGFIFEAGCFKSESRPKLWQSIEDTARVRGASFAQEMLAER